MITNLMNNTHKERTTKFYRKEALTKQEWYEHGIPVEALGKQDLKFLARYLYGMAFPVKCPKHIVVDVLRDNGVSRMDYRLVQQSLEKKEQAMMGLN